MVSTRLEYFAMTVGDDQTLLINLGRAILVPLALILWLDTGHLTHQRGLTIATLRRCALF